MIIVLVRSNWVPFLLLTSKMTLLGTLMNLNRLLGSGRQNSWLNISFLLGFFSLKSTLLNSKSIIGSTFFCIIAVYITNFTLGWLHRKYNKAFAWNLITTFFFSLSIIVPFKESIIRICGPSLTWFNYSLISIIDFIKLMWSTFLISVSWFKDSVWYIGFSMFVSIIVIITSLSFGPALITSMWSRVNELPFWSCLILPNLIVSCICQSVIFLSIILSRAWVE